MELWIVYNQIDTNKDKKVSLPEFKTAVDMLGCWGIEVEDTELTFRQIDTNNGGFILFDEFADWVINQGLYEQDEDEQNGTV
mmetsp:Transcript_60757/g.51444  ORF Transcript_60757/g.51444 Transcript_60757/m.51444 type:complete len:82 (+) Transcript_60757:436-681(+)